MRSSWPGIPDREGGRAVAEILTGAVSPSGKLPISIERRAEDNPCYGSYYENVDRSHRKGAPQPRVNYDEGIFVGYRGYDRTATEPLYAFGYGLSYTTFAYSGLKVARQDDGSCRVSFDVRNTGRRDGAEVAQLYVSDLAASVPRPVRELKGYEKVFLKQGRDEARGDTPAARRLRLLRYGAPRLRGRAGRFPDSGGRFVARPAAEKGRSASTDLRRAAGIRREADAAASVSRRPARCRGSAVRVEMTEASYAGGFCRLQEHPAYCSRKRSQSSAAMQPEPAAVMACR